MVICLASTGSEYVLLAAQPARGKPAGETAAAAGSGERIKEAQKRNSKKSPSAAAASGAPKPSSTNSRASKSAVSGYSGGRVDNPTYEQVCTGRTGHAEVIQVTYDPAKIIVRRPARSLLADARPHDAQPPGPRRRHAVPLRHLLPQRRAAQAKPSTTRRSSTSRGAFGAPIVTEITKFEKFYPAEDYHQEYYADNPAQGYCRLVIRPKVEKFRKAFADKLKVNDKESQRIMPTAESALPRDERLGEWALLTHSCVIEVKESYQCRD